VSGERGGGGRGGGGAVSCALAADQTAEGSRRGAPVRWPRSRPNGSSMGGWSVESSGRLKAQGSCAGSWSISTCCQGGAAVKADRVRPGGPV
jgi:hypothetical protein